MSLLKMASLQRGIIDTQFDDICRKIYSQRDPVANPFGSEELTKSFGDLNVFDRVITCIIDLVCPC